MTATVTSLRRFTVGGSDAAAACGIHPYTSPVMLWAEKTGRIDRPESEAMRWGTLLQDVIALDVAERYETSAGTTEVSDPDRLWLVGHPDGFLLDGGETCVAEYKTASVHAHRNGWDEGLPVEYAAQAQLYLHLCGLDRALVACLVGGQRLVESWVRRDDKAIALLLDGCERFHDCLIRDTPPRPDGHKATREALLAVYPSATSGRVYRLSRDEALTWGELKQLRAQRDALDEQIAERENRLRLAMGDAETAITPNDREAIRYRSYTAKRFDSARFREDYPELAEAYTKATETRRFEVR